MSITIALGMLLEGAYGETKSELKNSFLGDNIDDDKVFYCIKKHILNRNCLDNATICEMVRRSQTSQHRRKQFIAYCKQIIHREKF